MDFDTEAWQSLLMAYSHARLRVANWPSHVFDTFPFPRDLIAFSKEKEAYLEYQRLLESPDKIAASYACVALYADASEEEHKRFGTIVKLLSQSFQLASDFGMRRACEELQTCLSSASITNRGLIGIIASYLTPPECVLVFAIPSDRLRPDLEFVAERCRQQKDTFLLCNISIYAAILHNYQLLLMDPIGVPTPCGEQQSEDDIATRQRLCQCCSVEKRRRHRHCRYCVFQQHGNRVRRLCLSCRVEATCRWTFTYGRSRCTCMSAKFRWSLSDVTDSEWLARTRRETDVLGYLKHA